MKIKYKLYLIFLYPVLNSYILSVFMYYLNSNLELD